MAKPRIFLSSTFYDLKQIRSDLNLFIESLGYETIRNEEGNIPYGKDDALEEYCYKEIKNIDILISIIGGRFGSESKRNSSSISNLELKTAIKEGKQVYIFIEKHVLAEYETYLLNKDKKMKFRYVDDIRIYEFIEEMKGLSSNNNIKSFETASEINRYLKEQFAGLFQRFLENQSRTKEISLINNLEKTANTLNKLVNYISNENKDKTNEINQILSINHPLVNEIKNELNIKYNFYIEGLEDLEILLNARGYSEDLFPACEKYHYWEKSDNRNHYSIRIIKEIFDENNKLKLLRTSEWKDEYFQSTNGQINTEETDDLPF